MKKFKYRMEPLLKMREHQEKEKQKLLAAIQNKRLKHESEMEKMGVHKESTLHNKDAKSTGSFTVAEMLVYSRYIQKLKKDQLVNNELLKAISADEEQKRKLLLEAARERKKYEKLRDKQKEKYYQAFKEAEDKDSDETAINSFRLKKKKQ